MRNTFTVTALGAVTGIGAFDTISDTPIHHDPQNDLLIKMIVGVVVGVVIPFLNDVRQIFVEKLRGKKDKESEFPKTTSMK